MPGRLAARYGALAFLIVSIIMTTGDSVGTCSCGGAPVCGIDAREPAEGTVVFIGTAVSVKHPITRFTVERVLVGPAASELTLGPVSRRLADNAPVISSSCDVGFTANRRYLVYAWRDPETGDLMTSYCSRTRPASAPEAMADVAYFEARAAGRSTDGWLSGVVQEQHYDSSRDADGDVRDWVVRPLANVRVNATSPEGVVHSTTTNAYGMYVFEGLKQSRGAAWRIKAELPEPFAPHDGSVSMRFDGALPRVTWFRNATCAEANVVARVDGRIAGRVLDELGQTARGVVLQLVNAATFEQEPWASVEEKAVSDDDGRFEFRTLPAGRYVLGVEFDQQGSRDGTLDRRRYYPGVRDSTQAKVIELRRGERLRIEPFRLPPLPKTRTLTVVLRAPTPDIAARASVFITGAVKERLNLVAGSASLQLPYGANYSLSVQPPDGYVVSTERTPHSSSWQANRLAADETDRTITFTLQPVRR